MRSRWWPTSSRGAAISNIQNKTVERPLCMNTGTEARRFVCVWRRSFVGCDVGTHPAVRPAFARDGGFRLWYNSRAVIGCFYSRSCNYGKTTSRSFDTTRQILHTSIMPTVTFPRHFSKNEDFVAIPRKEYDRFFAPQKNRRRTEEKEMTTEDLLALSREAKQLHKEGKLPFLTSLKEFRNMRI